MFRASLTPSESAQLQSESHPFPAYIDFIHGRPSSSERITSPVNPRAAPPLDRSEIINQLESSSVRESSPPREYTAAPSVPVQILQRGDILKARFRFLPAEERNAINGRVGYLHDVAENLRVPAFGSAVAFQHLVQLSTQVHNRRLDHEKRALHRAMPDIYYTVKTMVEYPDPSSPIFRTSLAFLRYSYTVFAHWWDYAIHLHREMDKAGAQGKAPSEAIPGWIEDWLAGETIGQQRARRGSQEG